MLASTRLAPRIYHVQASSQDELGQTFLRFQEHYESPEWRGKVFTVGQFKAWYRDTYGKKAVYEKDWVGFNFPSQTFAAFRAGLFEPLTRQERELLDLFEGVRAPFYVIGSQGNDAGVLEHEICHALYATVPAYRRSVQGVLRRHMPALDGIRAYVKESMYHPSVFDDEVHAYVSASFDEAETWGGEPPLAAHRALRKLRDLHFKSK